MDEQSLSEQSQAERAMTTHTLLEPEDKTGNLTIDDDHAETQTLWRATLEAPDADFGYAFDVLISHLSSHFGTEEALMERHGYPVATVHADEHHRVLAWVEAVRDDIRVHGIPKARTFLETDFVSWFHRHARSHDAEAAAWCASHARAPRA